MESSVPSLVTQEWLTGRLHDPAVVIVDCRYDLFDPSVARARYRERHIRGAAHMDLETELSDPRTAGARHPLPRIERFVAAARAAGISRDSRVVAYDENMTGGAARLWWLLRHFGHDAVGVLEGGLDGWSGPASQGNESRARATSSRNPEEATSSRRTRSSPISATPGGC